MSAKEIIGNRTQLTKWQDDFFSHMVKKFPDLERGESASKTGRQHIPTRVFKQAVNLERQAEKILEALDGVNLLNASRKRDEAVQLLHKFFPQMENLESQLRKYQKEIERQKRENRSLEKETTDGKLTLSERLQMYDLKSKHERLKTIYYAIPEEERQKAVKSLQPRQHQSHERGAR